MMKMTLTAAALVVMATSAGCTCEQAEGLYMIRMIEPDDAPECLIAPGNDVSRTAGFWDVAFGSGYYISPHVRNVLLPVADPDNLRAEGNHIQIEGFEYTVITPGGVGISIPTAGFIPASGLVEADGGEFAFAGLQLFPFDVAINLRSEVPPGASFDVYVDLNAVGETLSGRNMTGDNFTYPITVCNGCLLRGCDAVGACTIPAMSANLEFCRWGFDEIVDCSVPGAPSCN